jgi:hypothetical protein
MIKQLQNDRVDRGAAGEGRSVRDDQREGSVGEKLVQQAGLGRTISGDELTRR